MYEMGPIRLQLVIGSFYSTSRHCVFESELYIMF